MNWTKLSCNNFSFRKFSLRDVLSIHTCTFAGLERNLNSSLPLGQVSEIMLALAMIATPRVTSLTGFFYYQLTFKFRS